MDDDKKFIEDFLNGNEEAFSGIVSKYLKPVYNFVFQLTRDAQSSQDLTQEAFIKAWKNIKRFDRNRNFKTWIFTIAKNTAFDYFKKKKSIPFSFFEDGEENNKLEKISDKNILPDELLERKNLAADLENMLSKIPKHHGMILKLHYREDFSLHEIAEIIGKPYNTIKSGHLRAIQNLKKIILNEDNAPRKDA